MFVAHQRAQHEKQGVVLTTAVINPNPVVIGLNRHVDSLLTGLMKGAVGDRLQAKLAKGNNADEVEADKTRALRKLVHDLNRIEAMSTSEHRYPSHKARAMRRNRNRKDHGTVARYKQIAAANAIIEDAKPSKTSVRATRREAKHEARSGHPRYKTSRS